MSHRRTSLDAAHGEAAGEADRSGLAVQGDSADDVRRIQRHSSPKTPVSERADDWECHSGLPQGSDNAKPRRKRRSPLSVERRRLLQSQRRRKESQQPRRNLSLLQLRPSSCRYPTGHNPPYSYCGAHTAGRLLVLPAASRHDALQEPVYDGRACRPTGGGNADTFVILAIDPGLSGALAFYYPIKNVVRVYDMPRVENEIDAAELVRIIQKHKPTVAVIEKVGPMPQGRSATGLAVLCRQCRRKDSVCPVQHSHFAGIARQCGRAGCRSRADRKGKSNARAMALRLFPTCADQFAERKMPGRAEAALMAYHVNRSSSSTGKSNERRKRRGLPGPHGSTGRKVSARWTRLWKRHGTVWRHSPCRSTPSVPARAAAGRSWSSWTARYTRMPSEH